MVERLNALGFEVAVVPTGRRLGLAGGAWGLRRRLRRKAPAVVHANGVKAALVAALAAAGTGIPVVWVKHDFSWDGPLARAVALGCSQVVGVSAAVTGTFRGRARRKVHVVPNGIPAPRVEREASRALVRSLVGGEREVVALVGRLHSAKGQLEAVEALPRVLARQPAVRLVLVGPEDPYEPDYAEHVRRRVRELGLEDAVLFLGHRDDVLEIMAGVEVVVVPSVVDSRGMGREGFGLVAVEALAVGTPVVGYADGALPEVLGDCARLVAPADREALAGALVALLEDDALRARLCACGLERSRQLYSLDAMVDAMRGRYRAAARAT